MAKTYEATKPWLKGNPPMSRATWYLRRKEQQAEMTIQLMTTVAALSNHVVDINERLKRLEEK